MCSLREEADNGDNPITVVNGHESLLIGYSKFRKIMLYAFFSTKKTVDLVFYPWIFLAHNVALGMHIYILEF